MHLKIEFDDQEKVYSFAGRALIKIGRSPDCDIQLVADGISRVHLEVLIEDHDIYVRDLDSTNGSFINEEKLEPNTNVAFNSFFPVRLGFNVFLSLLDATEAKSIKKFEEPQKNISAKTSKHIERTNPIKVKNELKTESSFIKKSIFPLLIVFGFLVYQVLELDTPAETPQVAIEDNAAETLEEVPQKPSVIDPILISALKADKCFSAIEKKWCEVFQARHQKAYYDGAYFFVGAMFVAHDFELFSRRVQEELDLNERQKREAIILAKRDQGKNFDHQVFVNQERFRLKDSNQELAREAYILLDFLNSNYIKLSEEDESIEKVIYLLREEQDDFFSYEIKREEFERINALKTQLVESINFFLLTGHDLLFTRLKESLKTQ